MASFLVPDDFRAFMRTVVGYLDAPSADRFLDAEDALRDDCGYGGRIDGTSRYRFTYLSRDGAARWTIVLDELEVRAIADGLQIEADGEHCQVVRTQRRTPTGEALLVWGAYNDDALLVQSPGDLASALDTLRRYAVDQPRILRIWSPSDDQLVAAVWRDDCALYVLESVDGYATSTGDPRRGDAFEVLDHDGKALAVPWADCVPWPVACRGLERFAVHGDLGPEIPVEGRIPSQLLVHGELDRKAVLAMRAEPARDPRRSSLARLAAADGPDRGSDAVPVEVAGEITAPTVRAAASAAELTAWAHRLIQLLFNQGLIELRELGGGSIDEISYQLSGLLQVHGEEAEHALDTAEWLANEINAIRGVARLFATPGDLQLALRRSRAPD